MNTKSAPTADNKEEGIVVTFEDVAEFLQRHAKKILTLSVVGLFIGIALTYVLPRQWEATGVLQIGQVANEGATAPAPPTLVEPTARALERLRIPQFSDAVLKRLGLAVGTEEGADATLLRASLRSTMLAGSDLIQFSVRGFSPDRARRTAQAISDELTRIHGGLMRPSVDRLNADLQEVTQGVAREDKRREMLNGLVRNREHVNVAGKFSENVLLSEMVNENEKALRFLRLRKNTLHELLSQERTYNTHLLGPVEVSRRHVFPRKSLFGAAGLAIGLLVSVLLGIAIDAKRRLG
ncbi:hypothetical protein [Cupriavidus taiwanensis]|uniref:Polysaccharide chain length determinant N-terminal domain-containing protein n=1 Tax=Cupriavidus taiwanensis (strain DSM 17343 / BCRC 17206 / CCUG 44338 / CIP 107171 / LMG 19424 / R1) TaxID=977880 RepID=B3R603_CUPTR|nr:hypothetical protein [Cupriavidus taiwanensis]CAQ70319.1 Conserved hypothetical protein; membrane protein [Cupriavidus taiwanensis LMG 19424]